jgi:hypothetical protein
MANWQVISLDTTTPQLRAPGTGDGYSFNSGSTQLGVWTTTGLGIGTASPSYSLSVENSLANQLYLRGTGSGFTHASIILSTSTTSLPETRGLGTYMFNEGTDNTFYMGTFYNGSNTWGIGLAAGATFQVSAADVTNSKFVVTSTGNVGIGATSPQTKLEVAADTDATVSVRVTQSNLGASAIASLRLDTQGNSWSIRSGRSGGYLSFHDSTERARFDNSGRLLVGGTGTNTINDGGGGTFTPSMFNITTSGQAGIAAYVNDGTNNRRIGMFVDNTNSIAGISVRTGASTTPPLVIYIGASERARFDNVGNVVVNTAAVATTATDGFLYIPTCAGAPTGVPTTFTGRSPLVVDSTNNRFYVYVNGAWKYATLT